MPRGDRQDPRDINQKLPLYLCEVCCSWKICFIPEKFPSWQQGGSGSAVLQGEAGLRDLEKRPRKNIRFSWEIPIFNLYLHFKSS